MGKRELVALLSLSFWCLVMVVWLFLTVLGVCLRFVIVVFPDHTHLLFFGVQYVIVTCPGHTHLLFKINEYMANIWQYNTMQHRLN